jgi:hypothetical protein
MELTVVQSNPLAGRAASFYAEPPEAARSDQELNAAVLSRYTDVLSAHGAPAPGRRPLFVDLLQTSASLLANAPLALLENRPQIEFLAARPHFARKRLRNCSLCGTSRYSDPERKRGH